MELPYTQADNVNSPLYEFALRHSVGLGLYRNKNHIENGSGTLFRIESRYFIATAAHCVQDLSLDKIRVAYRENKYSDKFALLRKGSIGGTNMDRRDVAYLELGRSTADNTPAEFLAIDQIELEYKATDSMGFLFGFPSELVPKDAALERRFRLRALGLWTLLVNEDNDQFPEFADKNTEIVVEYPESGLKSNPEKRHPLPHPEGISGGSIWAYNPDRNSRAVGSHNARLIGIQKSWLKPRRLAIGNKIGCLLKLIADDYPDVRGALYHKFGNLLKP